MASGWGEMLNGELASQLQSVWLPLVSLKKCRAVYGTKTIFDENQCAGGQGQDTCRGDSGGSLVCYNNGRFQLTGVLSWGASNCYGLLNLSV